MQTGRLPDADVRYPHLGCIAAKHHGGSHVVLPFRSGEIGTNAPSAQTAGLLGAGWEPEFLGVNGFDLDRESEATRLRYGLSRFGQSCLMARGLVESGTPFVTVNMFPTVFDEITWDSHGSKPFSTIADYRDHAGPAFDSAYSALLEDLHDRGLLKSTLVVRMGEFGRSPRINPSGGRDHWPQCWTIHMAGGGIRGGQVYGSSDATGSEPRDNPVTPAMVAATIYRALQLPLDLSHQGIPLLETGARPIGELFA